MKRMKRKFEFFDEEEKELIESIERGEWRPVPDEEFQRMKKILIEAAKNSKAARQMISIKVREADLSFLRHEAQEKGLPYQTLINSILHRYVMAKVKTA